MKLTEKQLMFNQPRMSKEDAIKLSGKVLLDNQFIKHEYIASMLKKEENEVTYIGNGIAIPHGMNEDREYVNEAGISVIHFPSAIDYDGNKVYLLIGIASKNNEHLEILQNLAIKLSDIDYVNKLVEAKDKESFLIQFNS